MRVCLITSTYNGEKYLPSLMKSLFDQTWPEFDIVIRDDGSSDNTVDFLRKAQKEAPLGKRIILVNDSTGDWSNKGSHQSYHILIQNLEKYDVYIPCDQDDVWLPNKVEKVALAMEAAPKDIPVLYQHNYYICDGELNVKGVLPGEHFRSYSSSEIKKVNFPQVIMTGTWAGVGMSHAYNHMLKELTYNTEDFDHRIALDCWVAWVIAGLEGELIYEKEPLAYYRRHSGTFSAGDEGGLVKYKDWFKNLDRHCYNIKTGIKEYNRLFGNRVSAENKKFLDLFSGQKPVKKAFYPKRLRYSLIDEIAFRLLLLSGRI